MIVIRPCEGLDEFAACVALQVEIWGYDATEIVPAKSFLLAQKIGGQVIGAFDSAAVQTSSDPPTERLVGFVLALPGIRMQNGIPLPYLHSHMLAVRPDYRNRGLGAKLKWEQRLEALSRGIRRIEWTFDPLEIKNAYLNIHRLGAIVRGYRVNFYGESSSRLQGGLPTDRLIAEWLLDSPRVEAIFMGCPPVQQSIEERIVVPAPIYDWKRGETGKHLALKVLVENRRQFREAFSKGFAVLDFVRDGEGNGVFELGARE